MPTTLYLSPSASQSTAHAVQQARRIQSGDPLAPVQLLLPTAEDIALLSAGLGDSLGIRLRQFYGLAVSILDQAGRPQHAIGPAAARRLVRGILAEMNERGELSSFGPVWEKPGFQQVLLEWLREMKAQGIRPEEVAALPASPESDRDRQLAIVYARYETLLKEQEQTDTDGLLWLAADALEQNPGLLRDGEPMLVLGFDQFSRVQLRLLKLLSERLPGLDIYLLWDATRPADSLALTRLSRTRQGLASALAPREELIQDDGQAHPALAALRHAILQPAPTAILDTKPPAVLAAEAPSREAEVRAALRAVKRLLLDGVAPVGIALLTPRPAEYRRIVQSVAREYGLPVHAEQPLAENPAVSALLNILGLFPDLAWRGAFDALRSPYIAQDCLNPSQIDTLERLSRERPVVAGREQWQYALAPLKLDLNREADNDLGAPPLVATLDPSELAAISAGLNAFFDRLTPAPVATWAEHTLWLQRTILGLPDAGSDAGAPPPGSLGLVARCREGAFAARDLRAISHVTGILRDLVQAAEIGVAGGAIGEAGAIPWEAFHADLAAAIQAAVLPPDPDQDAVWFGPLESGRNRPVQHLLIMGLSEGEFPRAPQPDAFYTAEERASHPLPLVRPSPGDDACLWWQVIGGCSRRLTLFRPRLDENGAEWLPSPYWNDLASRVAGLPKETVRLPIAPALKTDEAASPGELLTALATGHAASVPTPLQAPWQNARRSYHVMARRRSWLPLDVFEGHLASQDLLAELDRRYGPDKTWSASRLGRYATCPYLFFAEAVLGLEALPDPEAGLDPRQLGSLYHAILELLYIRLARDGLAPSPSTKDAVLERLEAACRMVFPSAPARYGFRPGDLWQYEQREFARVLRAFVAWECDEGAADWLPYRQEWRFGLPGCGRPRLRVGEDLYLHGVVDRLDRDAHGRLRVIDYKSGGTPYGKRDIEEGLALQTALYTLAAREEGGSGVVESLYLHIPTRKASGKLEFPKSEGTLEAAVDAACAFVTQVRSGSFATTPAGGSCPQTCDMVSLCRRSRQSISKAGRAQNP